MKREQRQGFPASILWVLVALTLGWGFNWPMIKLALSELPVFSFRSICLAGGAAGLFAIAAYAGLPLRVPRGQWGRLLVIALFNITVWNICIAYGIGYMSSGRAAILAYTMPLWSVPLSAWLLHERITARRMLGVGLGMGAMLLLLSVELRAVQAAPKGTLLMLSGALSWAIGTVMMKRYAVDLPVTSLTAWQLLLGGIPIYAGALAFDLPGLQPLTLWPAVALVYNVLVAFLFCHWAWYKIVTSVPVGVSSLSTLMTPVVGVFSGMLVLAERPHWQDYAALGLVLLALATVMLPPGSIRALFSQRLKPKTSDAGNAENRRDFLGRSLLINLLRALHLVGVVGLGAAALGIRPVSETTAFVGVLLASGIFIAALDRWANPAYFLQLNGLAVLLKVLLLAGVGMLAGFDAVLFWAVLVGSVLMAHAPRSLRHRIIFWR